MGHFFWISSCLVAFAIVLGLNAFSQRAVPVGMVTQVGGYVEPDIGTPEELEVGTTGSALATAAFGLDALQPETFNSEIVLDIIEASPLHFSEKDRLTAKLIAAEAGHGELPRVLADIRISLAVE